MPSASTVIALLGALTTTPASASAQPGVTPPVVEKGAVHAGAVRLTRESWARPRSGSYVARLSELNALIRQFNAQADSGIVIRYTHGDEGSLWAAELRAWLVALGIPSARIGLEPVAQTEDVLIIENQINGVHPH